MRAVQLTALRKLELTDLPDPEITRPDEVLIKVDKIGVCGSDIHYFDSGRIGSQVVEFPFRVGHEMGGTVAAVGAEVTRVKVGDEIAVEPAISCNNCDQCKSGRENTCRNNRFLGCPGQIEGCMSEYIIMPEENCFPTFGNITLEQASLCEPLPIGIYALQRAQVKPADKIAILGSGPIGLCVMVAARAMGITDIFMTDLIPERLDVAKRGGAAWAVNPKETDAVAECFKHFEFGVDVAIECAGEQETLDHGIDMLRPGGKLAVIGIPAIDRVSFIAERYRRKETTIYNIRRQVRCVQPAIDLIADGKVDVNFMVTHHFDLEESQEAFELVSGYQDGVVKAIVSL
jgi:L-iditol 2-dehydrogenase